MSERFSAQPPAEGVPVIQGYTAGGYRVSGVTYPGGVLVTPTGAQGWVAKALSELSIEDFAGLGTIEVLLLGTGASTARPPRAMLDALRATGIAVDFMDSKAAARTYNVLANEGRLVAAALLPL